jgi:hypothetical protein
VLHLSWPFAIISGQLHTFLAQAAAFLAFCNHFWPAVQCAYIPGPGCIYPGLLLPFLASCIHSWLVLHLSCPSALISGLLHTFLACDASILAFYNHSGLLHLACAASILAFCINFWPAAYILGLCCIYPGLLQPFLVSFI